MRRSNGRIVASLPTQPELSTQENRQLWERWQEGLQVKITLSEKLPRLRMLLVMDDLAGHKTPEMVLWMFRHEIMPLYTPLSGSWSNMCESIQRIIKRCALECQHLETADEIIKALYGIEKKTVQEKKKALAGSAGARACHERESANT